MVVALLALLIVAGVKGLENTSHGQVPKRKVFLARSCYWPSAEFVTHLIWTRVLCSHFCSRFC